MVAGGIRSSWGLALQLWMFEAPYAGRKPPRRASLVPTSHKEHNISKQICIFPFLCVVLFFTLIIMVRAVLHVGEKHDFGVNPLRLVSYLVEEPITPLGALFTEMKDTKMNILSGNKHNSFFRCLYFNTNTHLF